jgi:LysM repeat protein
MCPSCKETLRLPKTPEEARAPHSGQETATTSEPTPSAGPAQSAQPDHQPQEAEPPVLRAMLATHDGRLKLSLALLIPLAIVLGTMAFFPAEESAPAKVAQTQKSAPPVIVETKAPEKPAVPPPPVAVSEMPVPPPPALPEAENPPAQEVAIVQPVPEPETPIAETAAKQVESPPAVPEPKPEPVAVRESPDDGLVEAIPATAEPEKPAPLPAVQPEPETTAASAELVHTVARGDTLNKIARKYQVSAATIKKANGMKGDAVMLGQKLKIPGAVAPAAEPEPAKVAEIPAPAPQTARSHTVVKGDTLERISRKYGVEPRAIKQANRMKNDVVQLGRKLVIPPARP